tara:strand:+ start:2445 stop:2783 length:339 start_codon:yes stop_codon:yes gene_type:complete
MGAIINASINVAKMPKEKFVKGKDGAVWYNFTIIIKDETTYGNNVWIVDSQTKEQREAKVQAVSLGNAKVSWILDAVNGEGKIKLAERDEPNNNLGTTNESIEAVDTKDLPF